MKVFAFNKDTPTKHDSLKFSAVCRAIRTPFAGFTGLSPLRLDGASPTPSNHFRPGRHPLTPLIPLIRHAALAV
jgi:hypothetical protein